ncbi:hypothetical protein K1T35_48255 (plasmid) [Pseudonocardia sp. DSM 110487]|uniref:hypothetical protein n=1 Tax=Pseudonocardia sp. DSM 110487 TaxID=2865833 RepID=UPI001C6A7C6E|nr:hypothetical protein [Pseudonocardia sp. DSM 110487]QYN41142.1 hypothetical protein K1T35_48255 [Pseudonocardia sp. DSM 110487]
MNRTAGWFEWASKKEDEARALEKASAGVSAEITRETMREGLLRANEVFEEESTR